MRLPHRCPFALPLWFVWLHTFCRFATTILRFCHLWLRFTLPHTHWFCLHTRAFWFARGLFTAAHTPRYSAFARFTFTPFAYGLRTDYGSCYAATAVTPGSHTALRTRPLHTTTHTPHTLPFTYIACGSALPVTHYVLPYRTTTHTYGCVYAVGSRFCGSCGSRYRALRATRVYTAGYALPHTCWLYMPRFTVAVPIYLQFLWFCRFYTHGSAVAGLPYTCTLRSATAHTHVTGYTVVAVTTTPRRLPYVTLHYYGCHVWLVLVLRCWFGCHTAARAVYAAVQFLRSHAFTFAGSYARFVPHTTHVLYGCVYHIPHLRSIYGSCVAVTAVLHTTVLLAFCGYLRWFRLRFGFMQLLHGLTPHLPLHFTRLYYARSLRLVTHRFGYALLCRGLVSSVLVRSYAFIYRRSGWVTGCLDSAPFRVHVPCLIYGLPPVIRLDCYTTHGSHVLTFYTILAVGYVPVLPGYLPLPTHTRTALHTLRV